MELLVSSKLIGQELVEQGQLTDEQLKMLLAAQPQQKQRLGEAAVALGLMTDEALAKFLGSYFRVPYAPLASDDEFEPSTVELLPESLARRYTVIALRIEQAALSVAMADPLDIRAIDAIRVATGCRVRKFVAARGAIQRAIDARYHDASRIAKSMDQVLAGEAVHEAAVAAEADAEASKHGGPSVEPSTELDQLKHEASDAPVVQFVNLLLMRAVQERASDIHIEPDEHTVTLRLRVDGQLREVSAPPKSMVQAIVTRIKLLGNLDIAERRLPQDGRFKFRAFDKTIDVRLSCLPCVHGEKLVLRILDRGALILDMTSLGFEPDMLTQFRRILELPHGLVILTGPTGSGKTTTLYAALNAIRSPTKNIVTVEDPVEYQIPKINQVHTKADIGLDFAAGLRAILRQDPDIIMVGEIRDRETADICIRASLTGHLVLSTLHTNDAVSAISRLTDMGVEPYLITATLNLVMAQRLARRICEECAEPWNPPDELLRRLARINGRADSRGQSDGGQGHGSGEVGYISGSPWKFQKGRGCKRCGNSGYYGRMAIYEQFILTDRVKQLIAEGARLHQVAEAAREEGLQTLLESALHKVRDGVTTLDEAFSVCATQSELLG